MRVAITGRFENSYFSGAITQVAVALSRAFATAGHTVELLAPSGEKLWFIDCKEYEASVPVRKHFSIPETPYDLLVEVVWPVPAQDRPKVAKKTIHFAHYPPLFHDMESSVYQCNPSKREFTNLHGIWTWNHYKEDDTRYLEFLSGVKVTKIPFMWDSLPLDVYEKETKLPEWIDSAKEIDAKVPTGAPATMAWCLRITESNMSNSSSAILPVNIVSAIRGKGDEVRWMVHNGDGIAKSQFFQSNVVKNCNLGTDISGNFVGRLRIPDMRRDKTVLICHQRWRPLKATLLDALYLGIPMIHNCAIAKTMGGTYYYELNQIQDAQEAWIRLKQDAESGKGFFHPTAIQIRKRTLQERFGPAGSNVQEGLQTALKALTTATLVKSIPTLSTSILKIAFADMWENFQPEYNFFYHLFNWAGQTHGFRVEITKIDPSIIFYGPFGTDHQKPTWKEIPKIFYTGENTSSRTDHKTLLNLGFEYPKQGGTPYIRLPLWMTEINWFKKDPAKFVNPIPVELEECLTATPSTWKRFCSFVATNPSNPLRNTAFQLISQYKPVEAAGRLFCNRPEGPLPAGAGGGGGERIKVEYYKNSKFVIAFENSSSPGYCTEKLFHAKVAGAIPIYWGDPLVMNDFEEAGFFHAGKCGNGDDLVKQLKELDMDEARCKAMQSIPALSAKKRKECEATMGILVKAVAAIALRRDITVAESEWATTLTTAPAATATPTAPPSPTTPTHVSPQLVIRPVEVKTNPKVFVTTANAKFIESAKLLLESVKECPKVLYVWPDVPVEQYPKGVEIRVLPTNLSPWEGFWEPQHFAWKLWVLHDAGTKADKDTNILYLDAGVYVAAPLTNIWNQLDQKQVFLLDDEEQCNERWCHPEFCRILSTTVQELKEHQITAGLSGYTVGSRYQSELFGKALQIAKDHPESIKGDKWKPYGGVCFGHRHDQSILSILSSRCKAPRLPLNDFYCDHSLRRAQSWGTPLYVHRGNFKPFVPVAPGIGEAFVINLDRRPDRLKLFKESHPSLYKNTYKWTATDLITLPLTQQLAHLFRINDFKWNKASMAEAVSHLGLWEKCANDPVGQPYLIMEDSVQLPLDWNKILPVSINTDMVWITTSKQAYILTQKGAQQLITTIKEKGIFTTVESLLSGLIVETRSIYIAFSDMWPGFNYNTNFIMDSLQTINKNVVGVNYKDCTVPPAVLICGPYSENWKTIPSTIPKVFFTAENWNTPEDPSISLYLTSSRKEDSTHMRIPTWMMFIDWNSSATTLPENCIDNPIRLPVHFAVTTPLLQDRHQFCGFVVSNPICKLRNNTFQLVNNYKKVNSGGALYNNIGGQLSLLYPGGGCGDISKHHFFKQHKFTISFENSQASGYITEKVLHSKMAGCIPIYWGDSNTDSDFVPNSFVNVSHLQSPEQVLEVIKQLETDSNRCNQLAATPILNKELHDKALRTIKTMSEKILALVKPETSVQPAKIVKTYVVNLDTRKDRWESLLKAEPSLESFATRISAVNGKTLSMSSKIYSLFQKNNFGWKKSVIGCNMSHIAIWSNIVKEEDGYFLVLEDDVRFVPDWTKIWKQCADAIPKDAELLYLGGILPPNKPALSSVLNPVNSYWATIKPNTLFSSTPIPIFHFCTYSYIISKKCAQKLLNYLDESELKFPLVVDHFLGHHSLQMNTYVATPLLTYCFQDLDPKYQTSQFNNLKREDTFDSDIWNNKECFTEEELKLYEESFLPDEIVSVMASFMKPQIIPTTADHPSNSKPVYAIENTGIDYEKAWLEDIFQTPLHVFPAEKLPNNSILLYQRTPPTFQVGLYKELLDTAEGKVILLHLSDEDGKDPIELYNHPAVKQVIRNYYRKDLGSNVLTIPLGYSAKSISANRTFAERSLLWSFAGSIDRPGRADALRVLESLTPFEKKTKATFGDPSPLVGSAYTDQLLNTKFVPAFTGFWSLESFRLYEALEAGAIPLYVPSEGKLGDEYTEVLGKSPILALPSWAQAPTLLQQLSKNSEVMEQHRQDLQTWWIQKKQSFRTILSTILTSS